MCGKLIQHLTYAVQFWAVIQESRSEDDKIYEAKARFNTFSISRCSPFIAVALPASGPSNKDYFSHTRSLQCGIFLINFVHLFDSPRLYVTTTI